MNCSRIIGLIAFLFFIHLTNAQMFEEAIKFNKSFNVNAISSVKLLNKYGNIFVSTWDKDSVFIEITLSIFEQNENRFKKVKENIKIEFSKIQNTIVAKTIFGSKYSTLIKDVAEATNYMSASKSQTKIEYRVFVPKYINLIINNKYGDVILPSIKGNVNVELSNGNLQARDLDGTANLSLAFGNAEINNIQMSNMNLNFVSLNIKNTSNISLESRSSEISISNVKTLRLNSRRDEIAIQSAGSVFGETYFSRVLLNKVIKECHLKTSYGDVSILGLEPSFNDLELNSQACNLNIAFKTPNAYNALIRAKDSHLTLPTELKPTIQNYKQQIEFDIVKFIYKQELGLAQVKINISGADLKISHH
ncbi:MAG: hypothetical protein JW717_09265 [Marinilabiliaceae bacterium]|nr:hypothetical protein [Marinilabiliaceae bacterium]